MIMAEKDSVTGLYTKVKFYREVRQLLDEEPDQTFAFMRFDIDRFKMINNFYGIKEGDKILKSIAKELRRIATAFDKILFGRLENDVFEFKCKITVKSTEYLFKIFIKNLSFLREL